MTGFITVFLTVFLAELGDKTQVATMLFATDENRSKLVVFAASSAALIASAGAAVLLGAAVERHLANLPLKLLAGLGFAVIGVLMIADHFRAV